MIKERAHKLIKWINLILLIILVLLAITLVGARLLGTDLYVVLSSSMEPNYKTGSVIYVVDVEENELSINDVITYQIESGTIVTHRIVEIVKEENDILFKTKGDANEIVDSMPIYGNQIIGKVIFTIPYLGYFVSYIQTTSGKYMMFAVMGLILLLQFLPEILFSKNSKKEQIEEEKV